MKRNLILICLLSFIGLTATVNTFAQAGKFYSSSHDLSNSLINDICQDGKGYIWVSTEDGLNRFDGNKFTIYKHDSSPGSIKNDYVHAMLSDSKGRFWVGCINGLMEYDYATDTFKDVPILRDGVLIEPHITSIIERKCGEIWFATSGQNILILNENSSSVEVMKEFPAYVSTMYEDIQENIWIGTGSTGIFKYITSDRQIIPYNIGAKSEVQSEVSSFCEDRWGTLYVGSIGGGAAKLDRKTDQFIHLPFNGRNNLHIRSLLPDEDGAILVGTDGEGLKIVTDDNSSLIDCKKYQEPVEMSGAKIHSMLKDRDGNLWMGLFQKGLAFFPKTFFKFRYFGYLSTNRNTIGSSCVTSISADDDTNIWVGTDTDGVYLVDCSGKLLRHYVIGDDSTSGPSSIMAIFETTDKQVLLGSYHRGMMILDKVSGKIKSIPGISRVTSFAEDNDNNIYVATLGSGIWRMNLRTGEKFNYSAPEENSDPEWKENRLHNNWVSCMTIDSQGILWIGTYRGLACYHIQKDSFITPSGVNNLLPNKIIHYITEDTSGNVWIGSSEGMYKYSKNTQEFQLYTKAEGLPDNVICGLACDTQECIWISTHHGISKYSPMENTFSNFNEEDGLQGNEFTKSAAYRNKNGMILFGGINGVTAFYPWDVKQTTRKIDIMLTDFIVRDHSVRKGELSSNNIITDKSISETYRFHLGYMDNTFRLEYSAMDYSNPNQIIWEHRIKELGKDWISSDPGVNHISYSYIKPGTHTIQTRANRNGVFSDIYEIQVIIDRPWFLSWWMIILFLLMAGLIVLMIVVAIKNKRAHILELQNQKRLENINEAKLQYFMNISHEIRNPMTMIISPLEKLLKDEKDTERKQSLTVMYRNAQRILRLINQLMDTRKIEKGQMSIKCRETDIVNFIKDIKITFDHVSEERSIRFEFLNPFRELKVWIDLNNFDKILLNIISNAFKYTSPGGEILISLKTGEDPSVSGPLSQWWEVSVTDDGIGIDKDKIDKIFERFYQVPNDITNSYFSTGIGLHLARSLVLLHHGTITAENRTDRHGSIFTVRMPLGHEHLRPEEFDNSELLRKSNHSSLQDNIIPPEIASLL